MSIKVSDHHFGIGSDGLITIGPSEIADFTMHIYNADGSEAEMCGNGVRCVGKYVYDHGLTEKEVVSVETGAGIMVLELNVKNGKVATVRVDMGEPIFEPDAAMLSSIGEGVIKVNQAVPGYFNKDNLRPITGIVPSNLPAPQTVPGQPVSE